MGKYKPKIVKSYNIYQIESIGGKVLAGGFPDIKTAKRGLSRYKTGKGSVFDKK